MCKNTIQFQKGIGVMQFMVNYGSEDQCENALFSWRWSAGISALTVDARLKANVRALSELIP